MHPPITRVIKHTPPNFIQKSNLFINLKTVVACFHLQFFNLKTRVMSEEN